MNLVPSSVDGLQTSPALSADQDVATWTDPLGRVTTYTLDSLGQPTEIQTPDGGTQTYQYDFAGQPTVYTDELGRVTTYTYQFGSGDGELIQQTNPDGGTTQYQYNPTFHEVTQETDPLGRVTTYLYNSVGRSDGDHRPDGPGDDRGLVRWTACRAKLTRWAARQVMCTIASARRLSRSTRWAGSRLIPMTRRVTRPRSRTRWAG